MSARITCVVLAVAIVFVAQTSAACDGVPNAVPGCRRDFCGQRCNEPNQYCTLQCYSDGCTCPSDYLYDPNRNLCVPPEMCTPSRN